MKNANHETKNPFAIFTAFLEGCLMAKKRSPMAEKKISSPVFSAVATSAVCLLAGCGGGSGVVSESPAPCQPSSDIECQFTELPDSAQEIGSPEDLPGFSAGRGGPDIPAEFPINAANRAKLGLVRAPQAWFSTRQTGGYTGDGVVVGVMEEVNTLHKAFGDATANPAVASKIHPASVIASPYPTSARFQPLELWIVDEADFTEYPDYPCLLEFEIGCADSSGQTKYFMRKADGTLHTLPGLEDPNHRLGHRCLRYNFGERDFFGGIVLTTVCPEFGALHGTNVASAAAGHDGQVSLGCRELPRVVAGTTGGIGPIRNPNPNGDIRDLLCEEIHVNFWGVAHDAEILAYARPLSIAGLPASYQAHADYFRNAPQEADVYNFSHSFGTRVTGDERTTFAGGRRAGFALIAQAILEMDKPLIAAAGNSAENFPRLPAALPLFFPELRRRVLAVAATSDSGVIAPYSNRCGPLPSDWDASAHGRHYCLAAPGGVGRVRDPFVLAGPGDNKFALTAGTSFAAPVVAGAFAIVKEAFGSDLDDQQLVARLVNTANNTGHYSNVAVYGAGLLDIEAAITPVGGQRLSGGGNINEGVTYDFDATSLSISAAFGDALQRALQVHEIAAFDELDAPFRYPLVSLMETTSSRETLQERHARLFEHDNAPVETMGGGRLALVSTGAGSSGQIDMSLRQPVDIPVAGAELLFTAGDLSTSPLGLHDDKSFAHPYLGFAGEGVGLGGSLQLGAGRLTAMGFTSGSASVSEDVPVDARGGLIEYALEPLAGVALGVQAGAMVEESRALGLLSEGGFGEMGESSTAFAGVSLDGTLEENWRFRASMHFGRTNLDVPSAGLLTGSSALSSSAFRFALEGSDVLLDADRIDVFVAQPLRIEGGEADFTVPVGRTPSGLVRRERISGVSLEPGGRELEFGTRYEVQVREDIVATGGLGIVHEGGHSKRQETEFYGLANLRFHF
ncbi:MAG: S8 family serine peptidase [Hyphomicrobiales bacterium]|nr:S8 family serine peptidase [Hyphomicrobiales bacterium]